MTLRPLLVRPMLSMLCVVLGLAGCSTGVIERPHPTAGTSTDTSAPAPARWNLPHDQRGIPRHGAYLGMAYGSNSDPSELERGLGTVNGIRRTYFTADQVAYAVREARADLAAGRIPWISFKLPYPWAEMAAGRGDAWARDLHQRLAELPGPVWVALHHEPEGDQARIADWRRTQERLAPIVRGDDVSSGEHDAEHNIAYTVVLTGWNQIHGAPQYSLDNLWPRGVKIDVAGFDVYNLQGTEDRGETVTAETDLGREYFGAFRRWSRSTGVPWAVAETGYTDYAHRKDPDWIGRTFAELKAAGGIAMVYFNTELHAFGSWPLQGDKASAFGRVLSRAAEAR